MICLMWTLDPVNSPSLMKRLDRHVRGGECLAAWVGEGWRPLVEACHEELEAAFPEYELLAIKQKWGVLEVQAFPRPFAPGERTFTAEEQARLHAITDTYRQASALVCEWCGKAGRLREERSYQVTLCDSCDSKVSDPPSASDFEALGDQSG